MNALHESSAASVDAEVRLVRTERGPVECAVWGEGPAVLALHGAMGGYDQSLLLAESALGQAAHKVIAVSRPGYLGSPLSLGASPEEQADLYAALLDPLDVQNVAIIAISGGGQSALQFALRHPDRCRALVMISACSAPIDVKLPLKFHLLKLAAHVPALTNRFRKRAAENPEEAAQRSIPDAALRQRTLSDPAAGPLMRALQQSTLSRMAERIPGTENDIRQSRLPFDYALECIACPMLVIHGTDDEAAPFAAGKALAERAPNAELFVIEGGRHVSLFTHLHEIRERVALFLSSSVRE